MVDMVCVIEGFEMQESNDIGFISSRFDRADSIPKAMTQAKLHAALDTGNLNIPVEQ